MSQRSIYPRQILLLGLTLFSADAAFGSASKRELRDATLRHLVGEIRTEHPHSRRGYASCSASRIGRRLILTAEHCIALSNGVFDRRYESRFYPAISHGDLPTDSHSVRIIDVWTGGAGFNTDWIRDGSIREYPDHAGRDWAIGYLEEEPFDSSARNAEFLAVAPSIKLSHTGLRAIGYGQTDHTPFIDESCYRLPNVVSKGNDYFYATSCYAESGDSGGPVLARLTNGMHVQIGVLNSGNMLKEKTDDEFKKLLLAIIAAKLKVPDDFRSFVIGSERFWSKLAEVKTRYGELHPESQFGAAIQAGHGRRKAGSAGGEVHKDQQ